MSWLTCKDCSVAVTGSKNLVRGSELLYEHTDVLCHIEIVYMYVVAKTTGFNVNYFDA